MSARELHVAVIPSSVRSPIALVHLTGSEVDDLGLLRWLYHPEQGWALGYEPESTARVNVRATLLSRSAPTGGGPTFLFGSVILTSTRPDGLVDIAHDLITTLNLDRF
jgi:hypothetical protein